MKDFDLADALLERALFHRQEIGDHGDAFEASLVSGAIQPTLVIIVAEIFNNLKSCLDLATDSSGSNYKIGYTPLPTSFEPYWTGHEEWITDFLLLCEQERYRDLAIVTEEVIVETTGSDSVIVTCQNDTFQSKRTPFAFLSPSPGNEGAYHSSYITFVNIEKELLSCIDRCLEGVKSVIFKMKGQS